MRRSLLGDTTTAHDVRQLLVSCNHEMARKTLQYLSVKGVQAQNHPQAWFEDEVP
jgi:hypothetical protein